MALSGIRKEAVDACFAKFDNGSGCIVAEDLRGSYSTKNHPKVQCLEMTNEEAFLEFLCNFKDENNSGTISKEEWDNYYATVSGRIDEDEHFCALMRTAWNL